MGEGQDEQSKDDTIISIIEQGPLPELVVFDLGTYHQDRGAAEPFRARVVLVLLMLVVYRLYLLALLCRCPNGTALHVRRGERHSS